MNGIISLSNQRAKREWRLVHLSGYVVKTCCPLQCIKTTILRVSSKDERQT